MTPKIARMAYLAWLRTTAPAVYISAVRKATGRVKSLGGLNDDLVQSALSPGYRHSFLGDNGDSVTLDPIVVTATSMDQPVSTDLFINTSADPFDTSSVAAPTAVNIDPGTYGTAASTPATAATPAPTSTLGQVLTAVAAIGAASVGVIGADNTSKLIALNTTRAQQGLPPVNAAGQVVTASGTASPALLAFENAITGGAGGSLLPVILIGGVLAYFLFGRKSTT